MSVKRGYWGLYSFLQVHGWTARNGHDIIRDGMTLQKGNFELDVVFGGRRFQSACVVDGDGLVAFSSRNRQGLLDFIRRDCIERDEGPRAAEPCVCGNRTFVLDGVDRRVQVKMYEDSWRPDGTILAECQLVADKPADTVFFCCSACGRRVSRTVVVPVRSVSVQAVADISTRLVQHAEELRGHVGDERVAALVGVIGDLIDLLPAKGPPVET